MSVIVNELEVAPAPQQQQGQQTPPAAAAPPSPAEIDEEIRRALRRMEGRKHRLRAS